MGPGPPRPSNLMLALTLLVGLSSCAVAAGIMVPVLLGHYVDTVLEAGTAALVGAVAGLAVLRRRHGHLVP